MASPLSTLSPALLTSLLPELFSSSIGFEYLFLALDPHSL